VHAEFVAESLQIRGFAGLPDGSKWVVDEIAWDGAASCEGGSPAGAGGERGAAAGGVELARRMLAAGAGDVLREAEAAAA
jgi:hypothetical protein